MGNIIESIMMDCSDCCVRRYQRHKDDQFIKDFEVRIIKLEEFLENILMKKACLCNG